MGCIFIFHVVKLKIGIRGIHRVLKASFGMYFYFSSGEAQDWYRGYSWSANFNSSVEIVIKVGLF